MKILLVVGLVAAALIGLLGFLLVLLVPTEGRIEQGAAIDLDHPAETVFSWLTDFDLVKLWLGRLLSSQPVDPSRPFGPGAQFDVTVDVNGQEVPLRMTVTQLAPPVRFEMHQTSQFVDVETTYTLEPKRGGRSTELVVASSTRYKGLLKLLARFEREAAQRQLDEDLAELERQMDAHSTVH